MSVFVDTDVDIAEVAITVEDPDVIEVVIFPEETVTTVEVLVDPALPDIVEINTGLVGPQGPPGLPGIVRVDHGSDPSVARPNSVIVLWVGSVTPTNRDESVDLIAWTP